MTTYSAALAEAYASIDSNVRVISTLELSHPLFVSGIRFMNERGEVLRHEANQPVFGRVLNTEAETNVEFAGSAFKIALPLNSSDGTGQIEITIDNVSREISDKLNLVVDSGQTLKILYREYIENEPDPQYISAWLTVAEAKANLSTVLITAVFEDLNNQNFPKLKYTPDIFDAL
jgi:hypothetical protein